MRTISRLYRLLPTIVLTTALAGCGHVAPFKTGAEANDPIEPVNRQIFAFNQFLDRIALKPLAQGYRAMVPATVRRHVRNVVENLGEPLNAANSLLQGNVKQAGDATTRFMVNSTFGLVGVFDVAGREGVLRQKEDFGQTLAVWGMGEGAYLMLPFLGPSSVRDAIGRGIDSAADPVSYGFRQAEVPEVNYTATATDAISKREELLEPLAELERSSVDFYASVRTLYRQKRARDIGGDVASDARAASDAAFEEFEQEESR
jgi:phospholipid-binding lipoprotein MlaA